MSRLRIVVDAKPKDGVVLTDYQKEQIAQNASTMTISASAAELDGVEFDLRVEAVYSCHEHDSTEEYACAYCRDLARDGYNANN